MLRHYGVGAVVCIVFGHQGRRGRRRMHHKSCPLH